MLQSTEKSAKNMWDEQADFYNRMAAMELEGTLNQVRCFPIGPEDTVIDSGCGPGRLTCQLAKKAKKVIAVDSSDKMLEKCRENAAKEGLANVEFVNLDWELAVPDVNLPVADVVVCSRSVGLWDVEKLSAFGKRHAAIVGWANSPAIPPLINQLFEGCLKPGTAPLFRGMPPKVESRQLSYNLQYNKVYQMGYEPSIQVIWDGFKRNFSTAEQACDELCLLSPHPENIDRKRFLKRLQQHYLRQTENGVEFLMETRSFVLSWETHPIQFNECY